MNPLPGGGGETLRSSATQPSDREGDRHAHSIGMPTYEYKCKKCRRGLERFQNMSDEPLKICPHGGGALRRIVNTGSGIIFKGSGFYATDYKSNGPKCWRSGSK